MKARERLLNVLDHEESDRVPVDCGGLHTSFLTGTYDMLKAFLGMDDLPTRVYREIWQEVVVDEPILQHFSVDTRYIVPKLKPYTIELGQGSRSAQSEGSVERSFVDEWGIKRKFAYYYYSIVDHPLKGMPLDSIESYPWPDPEDWVDVTGLGDRALYLRENTDYALVGHMGGPGNIFEQAWYLRGYTELLLDLLVNKDLCHALFSKILEIRKRNAEIYLREVGEYLDVFQLGDDLAIDTGPAMSPELYREMIKPYQAELIDFIKDRTSAKIYYHCDGSVVELLEDLIEIGVEILNPIQTSAKGMNAADLKRRFGKEVTFWGAIDSTDVLPRQTVERVREEVRRKISDLAPGGGYVLAAVHNLQPDVPPENIVAMYKEAVRFGTYPIKRN